MADKYLNDVGLSYLWGRIESIFATISDLSGYVEKETGKGLSANDFTSALKSKLEGIASGAEVNVQANWNTSDSTSDSYIQNKPKVYTQAEIEAIIEGYNYITGITSAMVVSALGYTPYNNSNPNGYQTSSQVQTLINSAISGITGIDFQIVQSLPASGTKGVIYLVSTGGSSPNVYEEYIWLSESSSFEKIGTTDVDLSGYWAKADLTAITTAEIDSIVGS